MAKMTLVVSRDEFDKMVSHLCKNLNGSDLEPMNQIVDFFQSFMIDMGNESKLGYYDYELRVDDHSISLDNPDSEVELRGLVAKAIVA